MKVIAANDANSAWFIYFADLTGDRIDETVDLATTASAVSPIPHPLVDYDEERVRQPFA